MAERGLLYVFVFDTSGMPPSDCRSSSAVSQGYKSFANGGSYLLYMPFKGTKEASQAACEAEGGTLAMPKKKEDWEDVAQLLNGAVVFPKNINGMDFRHRKIIQ